MAATTVAAVLLAACGDDGGGTSAGGTTKSAPSSTTTAAPVTSSTTADTLPLATPDGLPRTPSTLPIAAASVGEVLPDGTVFGYITTLVAGHNEIVGEFDLAELLTGEAAEQAAAAKGEEVTDDYVIRNDSTKLRTITVSPTAVVYDVRYDDDRCCDPTRVDVVDFVAERDRAHEDRTAVFLTTEHGIVTRIQEQFFP